MTQNATATFGQRPTALTEQAIGTAVRPLRREFEKTLQTGVEDLSRRGILGGDLATQGLGNIMQRQEQRLEDVAGRIGTTLGLSEQQQAFQANQAAEQRALAKELQTGAQEFARGERLGAQEFATGAQRENTILNLALSGNLKGSGVGQFVQQTLGPGFHLSTQDETDLQRVAQASGLSVEDFNRMRQAIGQGQLADVLENTENYIESPEQAREFQVQLAQIAAEATRSAAGTAAEGAKTGGLLSAIGTVGGSLLGGPIGGAIGNALGGLFGG